MSSMDKIIDQIWSELDKDKSGHLDRSEASILLKKVFEVLNIPYDAETEKKIFNLIDRNNDNKISKQELKEALNN